MGKLVTRIFVSAVFLAFLFSTCVTGIASAGQEETLMGYVVKQGKRFVIEADDGDYIVKGKDVSKLVGKLVEVTGIITKSDKGDTIEVKSIEEVQDTLPDKGKLRHNTGPWKEFGFSEGVNPAGLRFNSWSFFD